MRLAFTLLLLTAPALALAQDSPAKPLTPQGLWSSK